MTEDQAEDLIPLAAQLVACVYDYGPDDVAAVLARVPDGRHDALAVVLAAMVDPDKTPSQLLAWTHHPVQSRPDFDSLRPTSVCEKCGRRMATSSIQRHVSRQHPEAVQNAVDNTEKRAS